MQPLETRKDYTKGSLELSDLLENPFLQLEQWLEHATEAGIHEPNAMCISTVCSSRPSSRMVLLRAIDSGLVFYTNYLSRKGRDIASNSYGCANFWWGALERQVRIEGRLEKVSAVQSDQYFASRPLESRYASAASPQSQPITRPELEQMVQDLRQRYPDAVPRPEHWGGFRLIPDCFEFWQGRSARLHDRIVYRLENAVWQRERLAP
ncbi:MAG: pyridoxamine 5'-phosphate oxidase [Deinococcales bacterium]